MNSAIELIKKFEKNSYSPKNYDSNSEEDFLKICEEYIKYSTEVIKNIEKNKNVSEKIEGRLENIDELIESFQFSLEDGYDEQDKEIAYVNRYAHLVELSNNLAHCFDFFEVKNKNDNFICRNFFNMKKIFVKKIITKAKEMEDKGIIFGKKTDGMKNKNSSVFVLDLVRTGQLSWHIETDRNGESILDEFDVPNYKYTIDKNIMDSNNKTLNSKLLSEHANKRMMNSHNGIVSQIPLDHEMELEEALEFYEEFLAIRRNIPNVRPEEIFEMAYEKYPNISQETYKVLLDQIMDKEYGKDEYNRKRLEELGGIEDGRI